MYAYYKYINLLQQFQHFTNETMADVFLIDQFSARTYIPQPLLEWVQIENQLSDLLFLDSIQRQTISLYYLYSNLQLVHQ